MAQNLSGDVMSATLQPETKNEVEYVIELDFFSHSKFLFWRWKYVIKKGKNITKWLKSFLEKTGRNPAKEKLLKMSSVV